MTVIARLLEQSRATFVVALALVVAGILAAVALPSSVYPPLQFPRVVVIAKSGTLPSQSMLVTVTRPLEQAVMEVPGIRRVRSRTIRGAVEISGQFAPSTDMLVALQQVQNRIAEVHSDLPADTELLVERLTPEVFPAFILSLTGKLPTVALHDFAQYVVRPELARIPGTGRIEVQASDTREIEVILDPARLASANLTVSDVAASLRAQNRLEPVGRFIEAGQQHLALASGLWSDLADIASAPVRQASGATVRVSDLGHVVEGSPDRTMLITGRGQDAVSVSISPQIGANVLDLRRGVEDALAVLSRTLPAGLRFEKVYDLADFVSASIASVRDAILIGGFLAVAVLLVFLRDVRLTAIAAVTLPMAVIPTFAFLWVSGGSMNLMSMGGLAVAIGLVIDDAVVVVENIHRHQARGDQSAVTAITELVGPLVSSTLTTVVVFVPLSLLSGVTGQFFRALSTSLSVAVLLSLALSITVVPAMAARASARTGAKPPFAWMDRAYRRALTVALASPRLVGLLALGLALVTAGAFRALGTGFLPPADEGGFVIDYLTPEGSSLSDSDRVVRRIEEVLTATPEVASYSRRTGSELGLFATAQNQGDILVRLKPRRERSRSSEAVMSDLRERLHQAAPLVEIEFVQLLQDMLGDLEGAPTPVEVKVFGDDQTVLAGLAERVATTMAATPGVVDIVAPQRGTPEVTWQVAPDAAGRLGLSAAQVAEQLSAAWLGANATDLRLLDRRVPVRVRLDDASRFDPARMPDTRLRTAGGALVPVTAVAHPVRVIGQAELQRENLRSMALVTARLEARDLGSAIADLRGRLASLPLPIGYTLELGGQHASQQQAFRELMLVCGVATVLVFIILLVQFRRVVPAVMILGAAPLSLGGGLLLLRATGTDLNVSSAMGLILLIGLVVKNGIMLLQFSERLQADGVAFDVAILEAGRIRLRPILMTTFCTLFALLPLSLGLGAGAELQSPLALAVIGGLTLSTPVTLLVMPGLYAAIWHWRR